MRKMLILCLALVLFSSVACAEESPYPFGIHADAAADDVAEILSSIFGEIITVPGFEEKTWAINPKNRFLYDFVIDDIQMYIKEGSWQLEFRLHENEPEFFADHISALYASIVDLYGPVLSTEPEIYTYDISGSQSLRIILEDPDQAKAYFSKEKTKSSFYFCRWETCSLYASLTHKDGEDLCHVALSWYKE